MAVAQAQTTQALIPCKSEGTSQIIVGILTKGTLANLGLNANSLRGANIVTHPHMVSILASSCRKKKVGVEGAKEIKAMDIQGEVTTLEIPTTMPMPMCKSKYDIYSSVSFIL